MKRYLLFIVLGWVLYVCLSGAQNATCHKCFKAGNLFFRHLCVGVMRPA